MLFKALSAAVYGIDAHIIDVEVDFSGIQVAEERFSTVGLPDAAVRESRDRVRAAIRNSGFTLPPTHITINLAPADLKKEGSGFDLPIAIGILGAQGALLNRDLSQFLTVGELGLDGSVRGARHAADCRRSKATWYCKHHCAGGECGGGRGGGGPECVPGRFAATGA